MLLFLVERDRVLDLAVDGNESSPSSKKIFTLVSSGVPSARVLRMTKLTQKWLRW